MGSISFQERVYNVEILNNTQIITMEKAPIYDIKGFVLLII